MGAWGLPKGQDGLQRADMAALSTAWNSLGRRQIEAVFIGSVGNNLKPVAIGPVTKRLKVSLDSLIGIVRQDGIGTGGTGSPST